jgi:hypothetical protein
VNSHLKSAKLRAVKDSAKKQIARIEMEPHHPNLSKEESNWPSPAVAWYAVVVLSIAYMVSIADRFIEYKTDKRHLFNQSIIHS